MKSWACFGFFEIMKSTRRSRVQKSDNFRLTGDTTSIVIQANAKLMDTMNMTKQDVLDALQGATGDQELQWMIDLGASLTVSARGSYPTDGQPGNLPCLIGFNELQHQVYGRVRHLRRGEVWTLESFLEGLLQKAQHYQISGDLGWALKTAISRLS